MISIKDKTVLLTEEDYNVISGIWGAFRSNLDYCATLLKLANEDNADIDAASLYGNQVYLVTVDDTVQYSLYETIFTKVFIEKNYKIIV